MVKKIYPLVALAMVLPLTLSAEVYRTIDEQGNVTYTDSPSADPKKIEKITIQPGPSMESINDTKERNRAIREAMEEAQEKRVEKRTVREDKLTKAKREVEEAKMHLADMEAMGDDDRQHLQGGKSFIKPEYFERVKKAQERLEQAEKRLREINGY